MLSWQTGQNCSVPSATKGKQIIQNETGVIFDDAVDVEGAIFIPKLKQRFIKARRRKMQIDCYGFDATSVHFQRRKLHPYIIKHDGTVYYIFFSDADKRPIHRITLIEETGETIIEWAYGRWDNVELTLFEPLCRFEARAIG